MTPLERLLDDHRCAALQRAWYASSEWEKKALAEIKAMAETHRRGLGQRFRYIAARLATHFQNGEKT